MKSRDVVNDYNEQSRGESVHRSILDEAEGKRARPRRRRRRLTKHDRKRNREGPNQTNHDPGDLETELSEVSIEPTCENRNSRSGEVGKERSKKENVGRTSRDDSVGIVVGDGSLSEDTGEEGSDDSGQGVT